MKFLIFFILLFTYSLSFSQDTTDVSSYYIKDGDTLGIILSIDQAKKIDSKLKLLSLYRQKGFSCDTIVNYYVKIEDEYKNQISLLSFNISTLNDKLSDGDKIIENLNKQIALYEADRIKSLEERRLKNLALKNQDKIIKTFKRQRNLMIFGGGLAALATGFFIGYIIAK